MSEPTAIGVAARLELIALPGIPIVEPGDDLGALLCDALVRAEIEPQSGHDVLLVCSKIVSRAENRFVELDQVTPSPRARELAAATDKDPRLTELVLRESSAVSRVAPGVLIVRHRLGFVSANAGIDASNVRADQGQSVLLLPADPDASARALRAALKARFGAEIGVVITDSHGRAFRLGTVGVTVGLAGLPPLWDQRGGHDLNGRVLEATVTAFADQLAAAADLLAGQAAERRPALLARGLSYPPQDDAGVQALLRSPEQDLYA